MLMMRQRLLLIVLFCLNFPIITTALPGNSDQVFSAPAVSAGPGLLFYRGDIGTDRQIESIFSQAGFKVELQFITKSRVSVSAYYLSGKVTANNYNYTRPLNFQSKIFSQGLQARYDFIRSKKPDAIITPFLTAGIEFMVFRSYTDLLDENGLQYHYWSDGTIRSEDQFSSNAPNAIRLYRDYVYETNIRDSDMDGFGKYRENAVAFPIGAGIRMRLSDRSSIHFSGAYHLVQSDLIDGISNESAGSRRGDKSNDRLIFTSAMFRYDFGAKRNKDKDEFKNVDFGKLEKEDADKDGIPDVKDVVIDSVSKRVDASGRPLDTDKDGIPDYRDKEAASKAGMPVNEEGVTITPKMLEEKLQKDSLLALPAVVEYLKSYDRLNPESKAGESSDGKKKTTAKEIPARFLSVDTNRDGFISPPEIGKATEDFMAGKSNFDSKTFYKLIDFYFKQYQ
jgi:hypothetical protein